MVYDVLFNTEQVSLGLITHIPDAQVIDLGKTCPQQLGNLVLHWEELHSHYGKVVREIMEILWRIVPASLWFSAGILGLFIYEDVALSIRNI